MQLIIIAFSRILATNQLTDTIPPQLGSLTQLREVYVSLSFPCLELHLIEIIGLPRSSCQSLRDLSGNQLSGTIPPHLGYALISASSLP